MKKKILVFLVFFVVSAKAQIFNYKTSDSLFKIGRYQQALKELSKNEENYETLLKTGAIYTAIDNNKKAIAYYEKALLLKDNYRLKSELASLYKKTKNYEKSISIYESILAKDSLNLIIQYRLGKLYLAVRSAENSVTTFKELTKKDSLNVNYWYNLAIAFGLAKDRNQMINSFLKTHKTDSLHLKTILKLATSFNSLRDRDSTQVFVNKGLAIDSNQVALLKLKVNQQYRDKEFKETIPLLLRLDTISTNDTYSISMLGRVNYNLENFEKAKKYFIKLTKIDKDNFKHYTHLGHIATKQEKFRTAKFYYQLATIMGKEKRDEEYFGLANTFYELEMPKEAIINYKKAVSENYKNEKTLYRLATISDSYYKDKKIAYQHYKKYLNRFKDKDSVNTKFVEQRVQEIKKEFFLKGEKID